MQQGKTLKAIILVLVVFLLIFGSFLGGLIAGNALPIKLLPGSQKTQTTQTAPLPQEAPAQSAEAGTDYTSSSTPEEQKQTFAPFWETWKLLHENFVDQPLDDVALMRGAISGMLAATGDKHTTYMNPTEFEQANASMEGEYEGIGAWVDTTGDYVQVISPMKGSPAEAAGLRANDIVIAVNGEDQTGIPGDLVLKKILGPAGEAVTLTIRRGEEKLDFTIVRAKITVPVVDYRMLDNNIAYVALYSFNEQATAQLRAALKDLIAQKPAGLIFDLRDNGGGYLSTAIEVVSEFIPKGVVMYEEYGDGTRDAYSAQRGGRATEIPLVVLVNAGTASASEITAGAIQDLGRGKLVGVKTYGKGSVQNWIPLKTEKGGVRITIARWLTPKGTQISDVGLTPDLIVEMTAEDYAAGRDPQLDAAVQLLLQP
ncbi:MAG TPA: S41 family peptidase [Anaerolineaceae bacterium]|jgi:carboxyl-terminal processing protease|nr:S41 family peptidase [Anaerolineaceae bacterium]HOR84340.1 S41 family peptidase [Anaerolineaceae bacterium]HPL43345.1 S41 family peptidase [Anaerolineaceae bacterium]HPY32519.1 S41 family peptidase [Anaerolineaceae bacterium]